MISPSEMLAEGGPFALLTLLLGLGGTFTAITAALIIGFAKWRLPVSAGWTLLTLTALTGALGTGLGVYMADQAVAHASAEMKMKMLANGIAVALTVQSIWTALVGLGMLMTAAAATLPALLAPGPEARFNVLPLGTAILGALLATVLAATLILVGIGGPVLDAGPVVFLLTPLVVVTMVGVLLAHLGESAEPQHRGRIAGSRVMIGVAAFLGIGLLGEFFTIQGQILTFQAVATASLDMKQRMIEDGLEISIYARWIGWSLALIPLFTSLGGAVPLAKDLDLRQGIGAFVASGQALLILSSIGIGAWLTWRTFGTLTAQFLTELMHTG